MNQDRPIHLSRGLPQGLPAEIKELDVTVWGHLSSIGTWQTLKAHQYFCEEGSPARAIGILIEGLMALSRSTTILDFAEAGQSVGGAFALHANPKYPISARALGPCKILEIPTETLAHYLVKTPALQEYFHKQFSHRMDFIQSCREMQSEPVPHRIAHLLLTKERPLQSGLITRKIIAQMASTSTETVIRILSAWEKQGIISMNGRIICIESRREVESLCQTKKS